jgi:hypothetical protein
MSQAVFRKKLVEHFDILWKEKQIQWPSRTGVVQMTSRAI